LGSESTFSTVPFDKVLLSIGSTGVHACNGVNVERIDNKIPNEVLKLKTSYQVRQELLEYEIMQLRWFIGLSHQHHKILPKSIQTRS